MARPTRFKFGSGPHAGRYVDEVQAERDAPPPRPEVPMLDLGTLPRRATLDPEAPLEQLYAESPIVRRYLSVKRNLATGEVTIRIRQGIPPECRAVAQDILRKYGPKQRVTADVTEI